MRTRIACQVSLCLLLCGAVGPGVAQVDTFYRIDVVVFSHLAGEPDDRYSPTLFDFAQHPDPAAHARAAAWTGATAADRASEEDRARQEAMTTLNQLRRLEGPQLGVGGPFRGGPIFPVSWQAIDGLSVEMERVWQRLVASPSHEPLLWRSWHQPLDPGDQGRWMRLRGGPLLDLDWLTQEIADPVYLEHFDPGPFPFLMPDTRHTLDGAVRLRQRQFLHVDINLVWQQPISASFAPLASPWHQSIGVLVHRLEQSRSVRSDRIEYFDSGWLGLLIRVEEWRSRFVDQDDLRIEP